MIIKVLVKLKRKESLSRDSQQIIASINVKPVKGAANKKLEKILAEWLDIAPSLVAVQKGHTSRHKIIDIKLEDAEVQYAINTIPKFPKVLKIL